MITLNQIRELIIEQDKELEAIIFEYFSQKNDQINKLQIKNSTNLDCYKKDTKDKIQDFISGNKLNEAKELLQEYESIVPDDISIYSISGIISLQNNDLEEAYDTFIQGLDIDNTNVDLLYNMGYLNLLKGNIEQSMYYYDKCLKLTTDKQLIDELNEIINKLKNNLEFQDFTIITLGIDKRDNIFNYLKDFDTNIINIIENEKIVHENESKEKGTTVYEVNPKNINTFIESLIIKNENILILSNNINKLKELKNFKNHAKIIYYNNKNYYINKDNYLNNNIDIFLENEACNLCDFIITEDINIYNYKRIVERRNNVYLINKLDEKLSMKYIINNLESIDIDIKNIFKECAENIEDEYEKYKYIIASECDSVKNCIDIVKYVYEKYSTEEIYQIYLGLLNQNKDYTNIISIAISSEHCEQIYKSELLYLNYLNEYDLIDFIINIIIKNYKGIEYMSEYNLSYKLALYSFELNRFKVALQKYTEVINSSSNLSKSVLVNRNIAYLMYAIGNKDYEKYYDYYEEIMQSLEEESYEEVDLEKDDVYKELLEIIKNYIG